MGRPHRPALDDYSGGHHYFLTICAYQRRPYFTEAEAVELVRLQFLHTSVSESFAILAYCFMPDHLHAVVAGGSEHAALPRFVRLAKQRAGFQFIRRTGQRLWQDSYFDRTLRREEALGDVIGYVIRNPIRAGLVDAPMVYPFWGSEVCPRDEVLEFVAIEPRPRV